MASISAPEVRHQLRKFQNLKYSYASMKNTILDNYRHAATLVPLFFEKNEWHILLTVRSDSMSRHAGDVAFPGGMRDKEDTDEIATALREAEEEIALDPKEVDVVCTLYPRVTRYQTLMIPVVGFIPSNFKPKPNEEVGAVFSVPLSRFLSNTGHVCVPYKFKGAIHHIHTFKDTIGENTYSTWGLTAGVCVELAVAILQRQTEYPYFGDRNLSPEIPFLHQEKYLSDFIARESSKL